MARRGRNRATRSYVRSFPADTSRLPRDYRFFREWAGGVVGQNAKTALMLARAERKANDAGLLVAWEPDRDPDLGDHAYWCRDERQGKCDGHEVEVALLLDPGEWDSPNDPPVVLEALGGIIDADNRYRRVTAAELAAEHFGT